LSSLGNHLDPSTGQPFVGKQIPIGQISPVSLAALKYLSATQHWGAERDLEQLLDQFATPITSNRGIFESIRTSAGARLFVRGTYKARDVDNTPLLQARFWPERRISRRSIMRWSRRTIYHLARSGEWCASGLAASAY
jgi:hypothetical protein